MAGNLTQEIVRLYMQLDDVLVQGLREQTAAGGMTMVQFVTLEYLAMHGPCSSKELSGFLDITPASTSALVKNLEGRGFLSRHLDADDRRVSRLTITAAGREAWQHALLGIGERLRGLLVHLSPADQEQFRHILHRLLHGAGR